MDSPTSVTTPTVVSRRVTEEQRRLSSNTPIRSSYARSDTGSNVSDHVYHGNRHLTPFSPPPKEGVTDKTTPSNVVDVATSLSLASVAAAAEPTQRRHTVSLSNGPVHRLTVSPWDHVDDVIGDFVRETTNDEDVPPGLLQFLQNNPTHREQPQPQSDQLAYPTSISSFGKNATRSASLMAPPLQSSIRPPCAFDSASASSRKLDKISTAVSAPMASNGNDEAHHKHRSSGSSTSTSKGTKPCWLAEAVAPGRPSCFAKGDEKKSTTLRTIVGGGGGDDDANAGLRKPTATTTAKQIEVHGLPPRLFGSDLMTRPSGQPREAKEWRQPTVSVLQPRYITLTNVSEDICGVDGGGTAASAGGFACGTSTASSMTRPLRAPPSAPSITILSRNPSPAILSVHSGKLSSPRDGVLQASDGARIRTANGNSSKASVDRLHDVTGGQLHLQQQAEQTDQRRLSTYNRNMDITSANRMEAAAAVVGSGGSLLVAGKALHLTLSAPIIRSPPISMGAVTSTSARSTAPVPAVQLLHQQQCHHEAEEEEEAKNPPGGPAPTPVLRRPSGCAATANSMIPSTTSSTDTSYANVTHALATACGRLAPTSTSVVKGSCNGLGLPRSHRVQSGAACHHCSSATKLADFEATAINLIDVATAASVSDRPSLCGDIEPSLMAGVTWAGSLSSYAPSVTSPTGGTLTSTVNYGQSGVSSSMTT
ncbi:hypothetical protein JKF63_07264 [Porcisia hertigi]|uniref:Uncharacterized protein n=1 Tax=Porcisia hertigi TaxID=2761500 RepID=A0A836YJP9_9TRYP|nr:hypothetical protein JKF63_07264 [Porcisia hertigi]